MALGPVITVLGSVATVVVSGVIAHKASHRMNKSTETLTSVVERRSSMLDIGNRLTTISLALTVAINGLTLLRDLRKEFSQTREDPHAVGV